MVRVNQFIALGAILALSLLTAHTAFAGPAGSSGDSLNVVGQVGGGANSNVWVTDPNGGGANLNEYTYQLFGPEDADYRFCASWDGGAQVPVAVKDFGDTFVWWSKYDGSTTEARYFGNSATDIPTVMDANGDGSDEIVVVRDEGPGGMHWYVRNDVDTPTSFVDNDFGFGPTGTTPAPGNWDTQLGGDEPGVTKATPSGKLWITQTTAGASYTLFGGAGDQNLAYTDNGQTRPGVAQKVSTANVLDFNTETGQDRLLMGSADTTTPVGNCNL
jgi:hypothetical protein